MNQPLTPSTVTRIPVTLLTGFLGAGKTTVLNHLLHHPAMAGAAVLINEFGEVGVDHHLVEKVDEGVMILDSGCLCCSVQGDLVKALKDLSLRASRRQIPPITRVLIETTGLADPVPVIYTLMEESFVAARYACDGVLTVVDASHALQQLATQREAQRQVAMADRLLLTKGDLTDSATRAGLTARLDQLNPGAPRIDVRNGRVEPGQLFGGGIYSADGKLPDVAAWLGEEGARAARMSGGSAPIAWRKGGRIQGQAHAAERHDQGVTSFVVHLPDPLPWPGFAVAMGRVLQTYGARILRLKGLVNIAGVAQPVVIHGVHDVAYPPVRLPRWPSQGTFEDRQGRVVFIVRDFVRHELDELRTLLADLPASTPALRAAAAYPTLPTRCWLADRSLAAAASAFEVDGWLVQRKRFASRNVAAGVAASSA